MGEPEQLEAGDESVKDEREYLEAVEELASQDAAEEDIENSNRPADD